MPITSADAIIKYIKRNLKIIKVCAFLTEKLLICKICFESREKFAKERNPPIKNPKENPLLKNIAATTTNDIKTIAFFRMLIL